MSETKWTEDQQKVIHLQDRNILVSAAAGSGKTAVLVERIIQMVTDPSRQMDIDRLLVVTFTKAAAGEMRARIGAAMEKKLLEQPENTRLQRQLALLHNAQITTIDSFCQSIIRNYFHVIDLDPVFRVADETEMQIMRQEVLSEVLEECYEKAYGTRDDFLQFAEMFSTGRDDRAIEGLIRDLAQMALSSPWPMDWLDMVQKQYECISVEEMTECAWFQEMERHIMEMLAGYWQKARELRELCSDVGADGYIPAIESDIEQIESCLACQGYVPLADQIITVTKERLKGKKSDLADKDTKKYLQKLREAYMDKGVMLLCQEYFSMEPSMKLEEMLAQFKEMCPAIRGLIFATKSFMQAFDARKREEGLLDFSDMEHFALQILLDHEHGDVPSEVAKELQEYYQEIMIDEYQDSSYIQEALLSSLSRSQIRRRPYLFMVGDVKQSIYRFRQARPELFNTKYDTYLEEEGPYQKINLHQNFRSREMVLLSANYLFRQLMQRCLGGIEYDEAVELVPGAEFEECEKRTAGKTEIVLIREKPAADEENEPFTMDKVTLEISVIGEKIRQLIQGDDPLYIQDGGSYRPVQYRDIVILLRSPGSVSDRYIETLADMGIPAFSETKVGYFGSIEVETVLDLLRIIDNPRQDIPLAAVLRSEFGNLTDDELAEIGAIPHSLNYLECIYEGMEDFGQELREKLTQFLDMLSRYQELAQIYSVYELLRLIYQETGYYHIMAAMPAGEKRAANLDMLLQRALEYAEKGNYGIFSFVRYIENLKKAEVDFGEASLTNENTNAVRIMSIHKSKGLEFPVVFLAGMSKNMNLMDARGVVKDSDYGLGVDYINLERRYKTPMPMKRFLAERSKKETLAEEIRILYVALTRAKELLILTGTVKDLEKKMSGWEMASKRYGLVDLIMAKNYMDWIMPLVCCEVGGAFFEIEEWDARKLAVQTEKNLAEQIVQKEDLKEVPLDICYDEGIREALKKQDEFCYPYEQSREIPVKISVSELKRMAQQKAQRAVETGGVDADGEMLYHEEKRYLKEDESRNQERDQTTVESGWIQDQLKTGIWENDIDQSPIPRPDFLSGEKTISAPARGTLYHLAFEHLPYDRFYEKADKKDIAHWLDELCQQGYMTEKERRELYEERFLSFLASSVGKRMAAAARQGTLHREQQFMIGKPASDIYPEYSGDESVLVQGIIDAWFLEGEEIILVDYKTDYVKKGHLQELADRYQIQLACYAQALERLTGRKVKEQIIYSVMWGESIVIVHNETKSTINK